jgi:two-component system, LuxR family, response regulator FixJ
VDAREKLVLIDPDLRRRAAVTHCLAATGIHVEPFEDLAELARAWPREGIILASDEGDLVRALLTDMAEHGKWLPLIAFAPIPSTPRVVQAVIAGAIDYLEWPFDAVTIRAAIELARSSADGIGNARLREAMARSRIQKLTRREREVLAGVADQPAHGRDPPRQHAYQDGCEPHFRSDPDRDRRGAGGVTQNRRGAPGRSPGPLP